MIYTITEKFSHLGLTGKDAWENVILDGIVDAAADIETAGVPVVFGNPDNRVGIIKYDSNIFNSIQNLSSLLKKGILLQQEAEKKLFDQLPGFLGRMESFLKEAGSGWFCKKGVSGI